MRLTEKQQNDIISFTAELIRLPGISGDEKDVAACVRRKMEELGYDEVIVDKYGSVLGILNGENPGPTLLFDGHMDVVSEGNPDDWSHEPYGAEISGGRIRGRGSTDMKGALAAMVCAPAFLKREKIHGRIIVSASVAEELMIGTALDHILDCYSVDAVIIGEPTGLKLGCAEKGRASVKMVCQGTPAHSSRPELGDNAVYRMIDALRRIRSLPRRSHPLLGDEVIELVEISSLPSPGNGSIPETCRSLWECRLLQGETKNEFLERWNAAIDGVGRTEIKIAEYELASYTGELLKMEDFLPGWISEERETGFNAVVSDSVRACGRTVEYYAAPYGCNALASASRRNLPTVILGPGDIALAHKPDESLSIKELLDAAAIYGTICRNTTM